MRCDAIRSVLTALTEDEIEREQGQKGVGEEEKYELPPAHEQTRSGQGECMYMQVLPYP